MTLLKETIPSGGIGVNPGSEERKWKGKLMKLDVGVVVIGALALLATIPKATARNPIDREKIVEFINKYNPNGTLFTYGQLKKWIEQQGINKNDMFEDFPRLFPFCVSGDQTGSYYLTKQPKDEEDLTLANFTYELDHLDLQNYLFSDFNVTEHSTVHEKKWVKSVTLSRINSPEKDMVNMRQWLHVKIETKPIQGILVQTIQGPFGLPFGDMFLDFPCKDDPTSKNIKEVGSIHHCHFRSRAHLFHPTVYVGLKRETNTIWHFHLAWYDIACSETPYIQLIFLLVERFVNRPDIPVIGETYHPFLSPVYLSKDFDTKDGAPYPYHPSFADNMYCYLDEEKFKKIPQYQNPNVQHGGADYNFHKIRFTESNKIFRIQPNEEYDECLRGLPINSTNPKKIKWRRRDEQRWECPPGPFQCDFSYSELGDKKIEERRTNQLTNEENLKDCFPCLAPNCLRVGFTKEQCSNYSFVGKPPPPPRFVRPVEIETSESEESDRKNRSKSHGVMAILAFLVFVPLANFISTFYKEMCPNFLCGNGAWIFVHIILHLFASLFIWLSLGPIATNIADQTQAVKFCRKRRSNDSEYIEDAEKRGHEAAHAAKEEADKSFRKCLSDLSPDSPHVAVGILALIIHQLLILCSYGRSSSTKLRFVQITLHSIFGHLTFVFTGIAVFLASIMRECTEMLVYCVLLFVIPCLFSIVGIFMDIMMDRKLEIKPGRKQFPVLEPIKLTRKGPYHWPKLIIFISFSVIMLIIWLLVLISALIVLFRKPDMELDPNATEFDFLLGAYPQGIFGVCGRPYNDRTNQEIKTTTTPIYDNLIPSV